MNSQKKDGRSSAQKQPIENIGTIRTKLVSSLSKSELTKLIRTLAAESKVAWTDHVDKQLKKRKILKSMALEVIEKGTIQRTPEPNLVKGNIECRMERYVAGMDYVVLVALQSDLDIADSTLVAVAVTVFEHT